MKKPKLYLHIFVLLLLPAVIDVAVSDVSLVNVIHFVLMLIQFTPFIRSFAIVNFILLFYFNIMRRHSAYYEHTTSCLCVSMPVFVIHTFQPCFIRCSCSSSFSKSDLSWCCSSYLIKDDTDISLLQLKICFVNTFFVMIYYYGCIN